MVQQQHYIFHPMYSCHYPKQLLYLWLYLYHFPVKMFHIVFLCFNFIYLSFLLFRDFQIYFNTRPLSSETLLVFYTWNRTGIPCYLERDCDQFILSIRVVVKFMMLEPIGQSSTQFFFRHWPLSALESSFPSVYIAPSWAAGASSSPFHTNFCFVAADTILWTCRSGLII